MENVRRGQTLWRGNHLQVFERTIHGPDGSVACECVERPGVTDIVAVFPVTAQRTVLLVEQFRAPLGSRILELAAGLCDVHGETFLQAAKRELREETGCIGGMFTAMPYTAECSGLTNARVHLYVVDGVRRNSKRHLDTAEHASGLSVIEFPTHGLHRSLLEYQHRTSNPVDAKIIAALSWWRRLRQGGQR